MKTGICYLSLTLCLWLGVCTQSQAQTPLTTKKIKKDLVGRKITDAPNGYYRQGWYWKIESLQELKSVKVRKAVKQGKDYVLDVHLILQGEHNQHEADVKITYVLNRYNNWTLDVLETKDMKIVQTHRYDNCMTARITGWSGEYQLELTNRCDVPLVVGGKILSEFGGTWQKFSTVVDANGLGIVGGLFLISVRDYKIHFIERP